MKIDAIFKGINDIKDDNAKQNIKLEDFTVRIAKNEESVKSAHKRIDNIDKILRVNTSNKN